MESLVHPKERVYFFLSLLVSFAVYIALAAWAVLSIRTFSAMLSYLILGVVFAFVSKGMFIGRLRGNSVRISQQQFPHVYQSLERMTQRVGLSLMPAAYVQQAGGLLNAFATRFLGRSFVVIYSDVLELAYEEGQQALDFVICHELAHLKRRHLMWRTILIGSYSIPWLALAYSRACEYTCDRFGAAYVPEGAEKGVLVLAAGKKLYRQVNSEEFRHQVETEKGFWIWYSEIYSTHPYLPKRIAAMREQLTRQGLVGMAVASTN
jgi:Zn-dependent protease with chaperone function